MKDGIGKGFTRDDHPLTSPISSSPPTPGTGRPSLASVIGEDELSDVDKQYLEFGKAFEALFVNQDMMQKPNHRPDPGPGLEAPLHPAQGRAGPHQQRHDRRPLCGGGL